MEMSYVGLTTCRDDAVHHLPVSPLEFCTIDKILTGTSILGDSQLHDSLSPYCGRSRSIPSGSELARPVPPLSQAAKRTEQLFASPLAWMKVATTSRSCQYRQQRPVKSPVGHVDSPCVTAALARMATVCEIQALQ